MQKTAHPTIYKLSHLKCIAIIYFSLLTSKRPVLWAGIAKNNNSCAVTAPIRQGFSAKEILIS